MKIIRIFIIISILSLSIDGMAQKAAVPIINKIINSYLDTLLRLDLKTVLLTKDFKIDIRFQNIPNFKIYTDSLQGRYYVLRYTLDELRNNCIKVKVHLNEIKISKNGAQEDASDIHPHDYYWIMYDCKKQDWIIKK